MNPKAIKIIYWASTILFVLGILMGVVGSITDPETSKKAMADLGYPAYMLIILGVAKVLGSIAILQSKFKTIKEWAYAGFTIDLIGAMASIAFTGPFVGALFVLPFFAVLFVSYFLDKKVHMAK